MVFPVVMYGCESWTIKKAKQWRIDAFELWCWKRLLRIPWTARISNQSILKEISPGCSLEGLMLKLKLQYFGHLMRRTDSFEKTLMLGKIEEEKGTTEDKMVGWYHRLNGHGFGWTLRVADGQGGLVFMGSQRVGHNWATELNWYAKTWWVSRALCWVENQSQKITCCMIPFIWHSQNDQIIFLENSQVGVGWRVQYDIRE